jgi:hypothetical protein
MLEIPAIIIYTFLCKVFSLVLGTPTVATRSKSPSNVDSNESKVEPANKVPEPEEPEPPVPVESNDGGVDDNNKENQEGATSASPESPASSFAVVEPPSPAGSDSPDIEELKISSFGTSVSSPPAPSRYTRIKCWSIKGWRQTKPRHLTEKSNP